MTVHRIASRLEKLERRSVTGARRYWLHFDEVEEMARHDANGWPYAWGLACSKATRNGSGYMGANSATLTSNQT
jgi:hypothetical protein